MASRHVMGLIDLVDDNLSTCKSDNKRTQAYLEEAQDALYETMKAMEKALFAAIEDEDVCLVKCLVEKLGQNVNILCRNSSASPLSKACWKGNVDIVNIIAKQSSEEFINCSARDPLWAAVEMGHLPVVRLLIEDYHADPGGKGIPSYRKPDQLHKLLEHENYEMLEALLDRDPSLVNSFDLHDETMLWAAVQEQNQEKIDFLMRYKPNLNGALLKSVGHVEAFHRVVSLGADLNHCDVDGNNSLLLACDEGQTDVVQYLVREGVDIHHCSKDGYNAFLASCCGGSLDVIKFWVEGHGKDLAGASKNIDLLKTECDGNNALLLACKSKNVESVKYLFELGKWSVDHRNRDGNNVLDLACFGRNNDVVEYLLKQNVKDNGTQEDQSNVLMKFLEMGSDLEEDDWATVDLLLKHKACDVNHINKRLGRCALSLMCAARTRNSDFAKRLVAKHGATVNGPQGGMALLSSLSKDIVCFLLDHKAPINFTEESSGKCALSEACKNGNRKLVELLLMRGASVAGVHGGTALLSACRGGHYMYRKKASIIRMLVEASVGGQNMEIPQDNGKKTNDKKRKRGESY